MASKIAVGDYIIDRLEREGIKGEFRGLRGLRVSDVRRRRAKSIGQVARLLERAGRRYRSRQDLT